MSLAALAKVQEFASTGVAARPYSQIMNRYGALAISVKQAELAGFDGKASGWQLKTLQVGEGEEAFYVTTSPRFHVIRKKAYDTGEEKNGRKVIDTVLLLVYLDRHNNPLHPNPVTLKLKGQSVNAATFYELYDKLKQDKPCWLKQVWDVVPRASKRLQALFVVEMSLTKVMKGQGKEKSSTTEFSSFSPITVENCESGEMLVGADMVVNDSGIVESYGEKAEFILSLFDESEDFNKRRDDAVTTENVAPQENRRDIARSALDAKGLKWGDVADALPSFGANKIDDLSGSKFDEFIAMINEMEAIEPAASAPPPRKGATKSTAAAEPDFEDIPF